MIQSLRSQSPPFPKPKALHKQPQAVRYAMRSVCPLTYGCEGTTPARQRFPLARPTVLCLLPAPGAAERGRPADKPIRGHLKALPLPWDAFCRLPPRRAAAVGKRAARATHCGGREKSARSGERGGRGGRRERGEGPLVPHDRMQGGGDGSALGFCEGKVLYPPVLTPRSTARLREGKM